MTQAVISQQLAILRSEDVVASRRDGARVYYRIIEPKVSTSSTASDSATCPSGPT